MHAWDYHTPIEETLRTLNDLISAGKIRYFGFSDTPAWKVAQAQTIASFRNWEPLAAIQIEYSLLERTVEGELVPAARELGLGIVPWSPLKFGILSGKYTRSNRESVQPGRGEWVKGLLAEERTYEILDVLFEVARQANSTPARVALNWLLRQPGVTAPIIGARTIEQLDDNVAALDVELTLDQLSRLSQVSRPKLNFPAEFLTSGL
jgi:aryl-alcohol dehydrogenase-like predicted oxidoreductase